MLLVCAAPRASRHLTQVLRVAAQVVPCSEMAVHAELHNSPAVEPPLEPPLEQTGSLQPEPEVLTCPFCFLDHAVADLPAHAEYCGSRTERCDSCFCWVQLRHFEQHRASGCAFPSDDGFPSLAPSATGPPVASRSHGSSYDGSSGTSPPDQLIDSGVALGGDGSVAICPYCDEECVAVEGEAGGAAAALSRHMALTDCAEAFAMQQLSEPWRARREATAAAGRAWGRDTKRSAKRAAAAAQRKQRELAAEYEAQAIQMYTPPSPPTMPLEPAAGRGESLEEALRLQEERLAQLTMKDGEQDAAAAAAAAASDDEGGWELLLQSEDEDGQNEDGAPVEAATASPAVGCGEGPGRSEEMMTEFYRRRAEPELAACYAAVGTSGAEASPDLSPQLDGGASEDDSRRRAQQEQEDSCGDFACVCEICGRAVPLAELEDHQMACQMSMDLAVGGEEREQQQQQQQQQQGSFSSSSSAYNDMAWEPHLETLSPAPRPTISVHRAQYDNVPPSLGGMEHGSRQGGSRLAQRVMQSEMDMEFASARGQGRSEAAGKKGRGKKGRRRKSGGPVLADSAGSCHTADGASAAIDAAVEFDRSEGKKGKKKGRRRGR